jgi:hypothetical protein
VNDVDVGGDLKSAVVFISVLGDAGQQKRAHPGPDGQVGGAQIHAHPEIRGG